MRGLSFLILASLVAACSPRPPQTESAGSLRIVGTGFVLTADAGRVLTSRDLVGAVLDMNVEGGGTALVRIDKVEPAEEQPSVLLHTLTVVDEAGNALRPLCDKDAYGRAAGFPVRGRFRNDGTFDADPAAWLLSCTSGSQAKCVLWGYDPWGTGPKGESLAPLYEACQHVARADYDGKGAAHTRDGTQIDVWDDLDIQKPTRDPKFSFEAGWAPKGAVCVARTRWPDLLSVAALHASAPSLAGPCDEGIARAKGAVLFTAVRPR
jgi:hypothetical protein